MPNLAHVPLNDCKIEQKNGKTWRRWRSAFFIHLILKYIWKNCFVCFQTGMTTPFFHSGHISNNFFVSITSQKTHFLIFEVQTKVVWLCLIQTKVVWLCLIKSKKVNFYHHISMYTGLSISILQWLWANKSKVLENISTANNKVFSSYLVNK